MKISLDLDNEATLAVAMALEHHYGHSATKAEQDLQTLEESCKTVTDRQATSMARESLADKISRHRALSRAFKAQVDVIHDLRSTSTLNIS